MNSTDPNIGNWTEGTGPQAHVCPGCGRCSCCGRGGQRVYPWVTPYPWYGQPYWVGDSPYPYYGTITVTCDADTTGGAAQPAYSTYINTAGGVYA